MKNKIELEKPPLRRLIEDPYAQELYKFFKQNGKELRFVGGCIRDTLLGRQIHDVDFCTNATPEEMMSWDLPVGFQRIPTGLQHGTITFVISRISNFNDLIIHSGFEVTTLRKDKNCDGRHAEVEFTEDWKEDARRRDFTINALYLDFNGNLYDYFNGYEHLNKKKLFFIEDTEKRIKEDYLRIMRYFRFLVQLEFTGLEEDFDIITHYSENLKQISMERKWQEFEKGLTSKHPTDFLTLLFTSGVLINYIPKLTLLSCKKEKKKYHPEGNAWEHTLLAVSNCIPLNLNRVDQMMAVLFHDIGKVMVAKKLADDMCYNNHDDLGILLIKELQEELKLPKSVLKLAKMVIYYHMRFWRLKEMKIGTAYDFVQGVTGNFRDFSMVEDFVRCCLADKLGRKDITSEQQKRIINEGNTLYNIIKALYDRCREISFLDMPNAELIKSEEREKVLKSYRLQQIQKE